MIIANKEALWSVWCCWVFPGRQNQSAGDCSTAGQV